MTWLKAAANDLILVKLDNIISIDTVTAKNDEIHQIHVSAYVSAGNGQCFRYILAAFQPDLEKEKINAALAKLLVDIRLCCHPHVLDVQKTLEAYLSNGL